MKIFNTTATLRLLAILFALQICSFAPAADTAWHHVHLLATDTKAAADWYAKHMEGQYQRVATDSYDAAVFGETEIIFKEDKDGFAGSDGSSVDHIGWSFKDLDAKMKDFEAAGIKILMPARAVGAIKFGFIVDPWGTKIEVMQDPELYGFHHIHLHSPNPDTTLAWYQSHFGGEIKKYGGMLPALLTDKIWIIAQKSPAKQPTEGRSVEHLGWRVSDMDASAAKLKAAGVKFVEEPHQFQDTPAKIAFIEGPDGVKIELVNPPANPAK